ncbi:MAG: 16S rRNA (guanine(527)-N(7))-methyltransferase RsmG [Acidiferrobacterales bacterium]|nr:16S rRNA (guanine(527)-N(7))-methyltransferase RsmG [Acidiferrobacterales bacterium]
MSEQEVENERQLATQRKLLSDGIDQLGLSLSNDAIDRLLQYVALLDRWNRAYNLTAIRDRQQMITHHLLDSLAIAGFVQGPRVLDMGTGPGLPGIPLAIALPEIAFVLLDSNGKKTRFLVQAKSELGLANVEVVHSRVEAYQPGTEFDTITARAFATLETMLVRSRHLCAANGRYLLMKGRMPQDELGAVPEHFAVQETVALQVPGVDGKRHLIIITPR